MFEDTPPIPPHACPLCKHVNDDHVALTAPLVMPRPGDVIICQECGAFLVCIDGQGAVEVAGPEKLRELQKASPEDWAIAAAASKWIRMGRPQNVNPFADLLDR